MPISFIMSGSTRSRAIRLYRCNRLRRYVLSNKWTSSSLAELGPSPQTLDGDIGQGAPLRLLDELNPSQVKAVIQPLNAITRIIGGPGSGKTRVLISRIAYRLQNDPDHGRILGVTLTQRDAGEMQEQLEQLVPVPELLQNRVTLGSLHSICTNLLRWNGDFLSTLPIVQSDIYGSSSSTYLNGDFTIIDEGKQLKVLEKCLNKSECLPSGFFPQTSHHPQKLS